LKTNEDRYFKPKNSLKTCWNQPKRGLFIAL